VRVIGALLTMRGWLVLALVLVAYLFADLLSSKLLYLVSVALLLVFIISYLQIRNTRRGLFVERVITPNPVVERNPTNVDVKVRRKSGSPPVIVALEDVTPTGLNKLDISSSVGPLGGYVGLSYSLRPERRGIFNLGPVRVGVVDAFGLFVSSLYLGETSRLTVYPAYSFVETASAEKTLEHLGTTTLPVRGSSADFLALRGYVSSDPVKMIHWRSSAKLGRLVVRELMKEEGKSIGIVLDCQSTSGPQATQSYEVAVRVAASIAVSGINRGIDVHLVLQEDDLKIIRGDRGPVLYHKLLSALATVQPRGRLSMYSVMERIALAEPPGQTIFLIMPRPGKGVVEQAIRLARRGLALRVVVVGDSSQKDLKAFGARLLATGVNFSVAKMDHDRKVQVSWVR